MPYPDGKVRYTLLRAAADLIAGQNINLPVMRCFSARQIGFLLTASDASLNLTGANIQVSADNVNFTTVNNATDFAVDAIGLATGVALNGGGRWRMLVPCGAGAVARYIWCIPWAYCRLNLVTGAGATVSGLRVDGYVWDDLEFAPYGNGLPPGGP